MVGTVSHSMITILLSFAASALLISSHDEKAFVQYMRQYNHIFTGDEYALRLSIFLVNQRRVNEHNKGNHMYKLGINKFSCYTPAEYKALLGAKPSNMIHATEKPKNLPPLKKNGEPISDFDFRVKGMVNEVQDQGNCGSCWAFAAIASQETNYKACGFELQKLSEQCMVDCTRTCQGCNGGWPEDALEWEIKHQNHCTMLAEDYPYVGYQGDCRFDGSKATGLIQVILPLDCGEINMQTYMQNYGSIVTVIDGSQYTFQAYSGGVYDDPSCSTEVVNQAVNIIGFGHEGDWEVEYWIVRNSFGKEWGEGGYIRIFEAKNVCGIANRPFIPICGIY